MRCPRCQTSNRDEARFCRRCGVQLDDGELDAGDAGDAHFCDLCGANLALTAVTHLSDHAPAARLLESERKQVTVLFADISGSTKLIAGRDPEDANKLLEPILRVMTDSVHIYGGTVTQIRGDEIVALFGAPLYHEDHALRACYAALHMHESIARATPELDPGLDRAIRLHLGVSSGEVLVGTMASDFDKGYSAAGEVIHLGARLQQMAQPGTTLCAGETIKLAEGFLEATSLGHRVMRGLIAPVEVFELIRARPRRVRFHAAADRGLSPFLGRQKEWDALQRQLQRADGGEGQVAALVGDAGIGKSRLVWEFVHSPLTRGWQVLEAGGVSYGRDIPYLPIVALLKGCFDIADRDGEAVVAQKVADRLRALGEERAETLSPLLSLLAVKVTDPDWLAMDPLRRREAMSQAFVRLIERQSREAPLILVVEDLHWLDSETQGMLDALVAALPGARILLLANYRPDYVCPWTSSPSFTALPLAPLSTGSAGLLLTTLLGNSESTRALRGELIERTAGNPFFLEECVRALADSNALQGRPGAFRLAGDALRLQVPASVRAVLGARIDRLRSSDKRLLQAASAIGSRFALAVLSAVAHERSQEVLHARLVRLRDAGLVYESALFPEVEYSFTHALTQEVAYEGLLQDRRRGLHAETVAAIERVYAERLPEHVEMLAYHAFKGEVWEKAATYARRAGQKAAAQSAYREAITHFEQSLVALPRLAKTAETLAAAVDTRFELRNALFPLGQIERDLGHLRAAEPLASELADPHRLAWISVYIGRDLSLLGNPDQALEAGSRALALAPAVDDPSLRVLAHAYMSQAHYALGDYATSARIMEEQIRAIPAGGVQHSYGLPGPAALFFRAWLIWDLARLGRFKEGLALATELMEVASAAERPLGLTVAQYSHGLLLVHQGDLAGAIPLLEQALERCRKWGFAAWFTNIASSLGYAYALAGRPSAGIDLLEQAVERTRSLGIMVSHAVELAWLAEACLAGGQGGAASLHAGTAVEVARRYKERGNEAEALRVRGTVALIGEPRDPSAGIADLDAALALAADCGMQPVMARCHLALAAARHQLGEDALAATHQDAAAALFDSMDMRPWPAVAKAFQDSRRRSSRA
ncbi:MAG TPA: AAA family ATPase [Stellaceae bacterium]|nr:AAA family ATPase [Stellaceae bacterium]